MCGINPLRCNEKGLARAMRIRSTTHMAEWTAVVTAVLLILLAFAATRANAAPAAATAPPSAAPAPSTSPSKDDKPDKPPLKQEELDQIIAPIALYPDSLLTQIL